MDGEGGQALAIRGFEPRIFRRPKAEGLSIRACGHKGPRPDLSPIGVRAAVRVRDNVLKVEYPKKLNVRVYLFIYLLIVFVLFMY